MSDKKTYRIRPGFTHGAGRALQAGDLVEMTEREASGFLDKLELVIEEMISNFIDAVTAGPVIEPLPIQPVVEPLPVEPAIEPLPVVEPEPQPEPKGKKVAK